MPTRVLLVTTNGTGMGHLARMTAVALAGQRTGDIEPAILTLSLAAPLASSTGVPVEYCPSAQRRWQSNWTWDAYLRDRLAMLIHHHSIEVVLFDGVMPYDGLLAVMPAFPAVRFIWSRRGLWRADARVSRRALARARFFDAVIEPGDFVSTADTGPTRGLPRVISTAPVSLSSEVRLLNRDEARAALGLPAAGSYVLFAFGSGLAGDSKAALAATSEAAARHGWRAAAVRAWADAGTMPGVDVIERVFPLVSYARAFDAVVTSAGYNTVHEFISAGIPTLVIPNSASVTDDQETRARALAERGFALAAPASGPALNETLDVLLGGWQPSERPGAADGAEQICAALVNKPAGEGRASSRIHWKLAALSVFGSTLVAALRRLRGRVSTAIPIRGVLVTDDISEVAAQPADVAVEHILAFGSDPAASRAYAQARRDKAAKAYPSRL